MTKDLKVYSVLSGDFKAEWKNMIAIQKKYFNIEHNMVAKSKYSTILEEKIDFLVMDTETFKTFKNADYATFKNNNSHFALIVLGKKFSVADKVKTYKELVDYVIDLKESPQIVKWELLVALRRRWDSYSSGEIIIYKGLIVDFIESFALVDNVKVELPTKAIKLLRFLLLNRGKYSSKSKIFKEVWGIDDKDHTRSVDQAIFQLKQKIGKEYFHFSKTRGVKFE